MPEGMKLTIKPYGQGLTVDLSGKQLLPKDGFTFQCPPLEEFKVTHAFTFGNYDTILDGQYTRRGSRQLMTWQFDTLAMEIGLAGSLGWKAETGAHVSRHTSTKQSPGWVPFAHMDQSGKPSAAAWYVAQLKKIHDAGAPFRFVAQEQIDHGTAFNEAASSIAPVISVPAVLLGFDEDYKHGEGDAVYISGVSFSEWRNPTVSQQGLGSDDHGSPSDQPPTSVTLRRDGRCVTPKGELIPKKSGDATLTELSKFFYHSPEFWRQISEANKLKGGGPNTSLLKFSAYRKVPKNGVKVKIPALGAKLSF